MAIAIPEHAGLADLTLSRLTDADADDLFRHFSDPEVVEYMDLAPLTERRQASDIIAFFDDRFRAHAGIRYAIRDADTGAFMGTCGYNEIVREQCSRAEVAYDLAREHWGKGHMTRVMRHLIDTAFDEMGLRRLQAFVTPGNERSTRVLERHGFEREGLLKDYGYWCGRFWDQEVWGRVCS